MFRTRAASKAVCLGDDIVAPPQSVAVQASCNGLTSAVHTDAIGCSAPAQGAPLPPRFERAPEGRGGGKNRARSGQGTSRLSFFGIFLPQKTGLVCRT